MSLRETIQTDAALFVSTSDFGESVIYRPRQKSERPISATVFRQLAEAIDDENRSVTVFEVHVINSATTGISSEEIDLGGDMIDLADRIGKTGRPRAITQIVESDEGMLVIKCQ
jgi:hypothetical protein